MTGPEHYCEAERLLTHLDAIPDPHGDGAHACSLLAAEAQVHATLALAAAAEDSRRLDRIRVVLARFDWEVDDRQLALEAIDRIADGGQA